MRKVVNVNATEGKEYDLDKIAESGRDNASLPIKLYNWYWHPEATGEYEIGDILINLAEHADSNPPELEPGDAWISIKCSSIEQLKTNLTEQYNGGSEE